MDRNRRKAGMLVPTIIMGVLAVALFAIGYFQGQGQHIRGVQSALNMTLGVLPLLIFAFIVAGMIQVLLPRELLSRWVGAESGVRGLLVGTVAGGVTISASSAPPGMSATRGKA